MQSVDRRPGGTLACHGSAPRDPPSIVRLDTARAGCRAGCGRDARARHARRTALLAWIPVARIRGDLRDGSLDGGLDGWRVPGAGSTRFSPARRRSATSESRRSRPRRRSPRSSTDRARPLHGHLRLRRGDVGEAGPPMVLAVVGADSRGSTSPTSFARRPRTSGAPPVFLSSPAPVRCHSSWTDRRCTRRRNSRCERNAP